MKWIKELKSPFFIIPFVIMTVLTLLLLYMLYAAPATNPFLD